MAFIVDTILESIVKINEEGKVGKCVTIYNDFTGIVINTV